MIIQVASLSLTDTSSQSHRTSVQVQNLTLISTEALSKTEQAVAQMMRSEALLQDMCQRLEDNQAQGTRIAAALEQFRTVNVEPSAALSRSPTPASLRERTIISSFPGQQPLRRYNSVLPYRGLYIKTLRSNTKGCSRQCPCCCHKTKRVARSDRQWTGSLSVTFSGVSLLTPSCSLSTCSRTLHPWVQVSYALPIWLANRLLVMSLKSNPLNGPELLLKTCRFAETPVYLYAEKGMLNHIQSMFVAGEASAFDVHWDGGDAMLAAVTWRQWDVCNYLLDSGANKYQETTDGRSSRTRFLEVWFGLKEMQQNSEARRIYQRLEIDDLIDEREFCSVHRIVLKLSRQDLDTELEEHPELINTPDCVGKTPLWWAANCRNVEAAQVLLSHGARVNDTDFRKHTPLHVAVFMAASEEMVHALLVAGADVNAKNLSGWTPLHYACRKGYLHLAQLLLTYGADVNMCDIDNHSPLYDCAVKDMDEAARILLSHGASLEITDKGGHSVWEYAVMSASAQVLKVFAAHGCQFTNGGPLSTGTSSVAGYIPRYGTKPVIGILHYLARYGTQSVVELFRGLELSHIDFEAKDEQNRTAEEALRLRASPEKPADWSECTEELHSATRSYFDHLRTLSGWVVFEARDVLGSSSQGGEGYDERIEGSLTSSRDMFDDARSAWSEELEEHSGIGDSR